MEFVSKIFLDGGDPEETKKADELLRQYGHAGIEGQTTNPSLIMKRAIAKLQFHGSPRDSLRREEAVAFYRMTVEEMAEVTAGPISIQVVGNESTGFEDYVRQARDRMTWIPNAVVKFPCTYQGLKAAAIFSREGPVNMTLAFTQEQAAAVYAATRGSPYAAYVSPFVGRLDDKGRNGMDVVANTLRMYRESGDGHVKVIAASIRRIEHIQYALSLKCDIISLPLSVLTAWSALGFPVPHDDYRYDAHKLEPIPASDILLTHDWIEYAYDDAMTEQGVGKFYADWAAMTKESAA